MAKGGGDTATVYASWNGATAVKSWSVLAGANSENLQQVGGDVAKQGFETKLTAKTDDPYVAVEALDADGRSLSVSAAVARGNGALG